MNPFPALFWSTRQASSRRGCVWVDAWSDSRWSILSFHSAILKHLDDVSAVHVGIEILRVVKDLDDGPLARRSRGRRFDILGHVSGGTRGHLIVIGRFCPLTG